jgi:hypothetical protein
MGTFDVLRCAFTARTRVAKALSFPVKRRPFCTKNVAPGILLYHPGRLKPLTDTFSGCAEAAKTPERLIEWFHEIKTQHDLFEVKWGGVCKETADFGSPELKLYASEFYSINNRRLPFNEFYQGILDETIRMEDPSICSSLCTLHTVFMDLDITIKDIRNFGNLNDKVKDIMKALIKAPLWPSLSLYEDSIRVLTSSNKLMDQTLALQVGAEDVSSHRKNVFQGVTDTALWNEDCFTQLLIGEGIGEGSKENGLAHLVMAMLAQCAKSACTLQTIWGFTLSPNEYTIVKLEVIGKEVVVTQYPSCQHDLLFTNFIPLMGLSQHVAEVNYPTIDAEWLF